MAPRTSLLEAIRTPPPVVAEASTVPDFFSTAAKPETEDPFLTAMRLALAADRPGFALACGHQGALRALFPTLPEGLTAFCASEEGGAHPKTLQTKLEPAHGELALSGEKRWASLAPQAQRLLVVASRGERDGRKDLVSVLVDAQSPGVSLSELDAPGLAPEVGHAVVTFDNVLVEHDAVLPGDGYLDAIKPFRTYEDLYIAAALQLATLRHGIDEAWPKELLEDTLGVVLAAAALAREDLTTPAAHIGLASLSRRCQELDGPQQKQWSTSPLAAHWHRTVEPPSVAARAKAKRRDVAWDRFLAGRSRS